MSPRAHLFGVVVFLAGSALVVMAPESSASTVPAGFAAVATGSVTTPQVTWATSISGRNDGQFDLFWQLFVDSGSTGKWALRTPPGVATNGGLAVASSATGTQLLVGFGPSQELTFSPLAYSSTAGQRWSPGGLTSPLDTAEPSALAFGGGGQALAISDGSVLAEHGSLTAWRPLVTGDALRADPVSSVCDVGKIEAVGFGPTGTPIVGVRCDRRGMVGLFSDSGGRWSTLAVMAPPSLHAGVIDVVRLSPSSALLAAETAQASSVFAAWPTGATWSTSPPIRIVGRAIASGTGAGRSVFVVTESGETERVAIVAGPGQRWRTLPVLPRGTSTIAVTPSGATEALVVAGSRFSAWRLGDNGRSWTKFQSLTIPIVYGSSD